MLTTELYELLPEASELRITAAGWALICDITVDEMETNPTWLTDHWLRTGRMRMFDARAATGTDDIVTLLEYLVEQVTG